MTEREQFYQLRLDDCATPGFVSFDKPYYGTLEEIRGFIAALEQDEQCRENHANLIAAFHAYESGNHDAKHYAAFQEIPLLIPVDVLMNCKAAYSYLIQKANAGALSGSNGLQIQRPNTASSSEQTIIAQSPKSSIALLNLYTLTSP